MNNVQLVGNLGKDPDVKTTNSGKSVVTVSLATSHRKKDGDQWVDATTWHNVVVWGARADVIGKFCRKGSKLGISGRLETRSYEVDGAKRYVTEVIAHDVELLSPKGENSGGGGNRSEPKPSYDGGDYKPGGMDDDSIPF